MIMLFCSYNGGQYWWMAHATWNGLGLADLFMPGYLFVMGVCVPLSLNNSMASSAPKGELIDRALRVYNIEKVFQKVRNKINDL